MQVKGQGYEAELTCCTGELQWLTFSLLCLTIHKGLSQKKKKTKKHPTTNLTFFTIVPLDNFSLIYNNTICYH